MFGGDFFNVSHHFRVIASSMGDGRPFADPDITMEYFAYRGIVCCMCNINYQSNLRVECIGDLACAKEADFLHDIRDDADFHLQLLVLLME